MKYISLDLIQILKEMYNNENIVSCLETVGYKKDNNLSNNYVAVYIDNNKQNIVVILSGLNDFKDFKDLITNIGNFTPILLTRIKIQIETVQTICEKFKNENVIFLGHSLGGLIINILLNNTKYLCYNYNPCFVNFKTSANIKNYRQYMDLLSLNMNNDNNNVINIKFDVIGYLVKEKGNLFNFLLDSHCVNQKSEFNNLSILIDIPIVDN